MKLNDAMHSDASSSPEMTADASRILVEGRTCWRIGRAGRAAVLVDGAAYYGALRRALLQARRSIFIVGWDIDSRVELRGESPDPGDAAPLRLGELLTCLVRRRPELQVHLLLWDYSVVYALEREPLPSISLDWATPQQIKVCLDDVLPLGASHHQKLVVVDDAVAFCGGLDLTIRRWDTSEHRPDHPLRRDPGGNPYAPFHDVQMCVDGEAARHLAELVRQRWREAAGEPALGIEPPGDLWPAGLVPDLRDVDVGIARTLPGFDSTSGVREAEALFLAAIDRAERSIYIENQFLTADIVAERLARRLSERPRLEALIVAPRDHLSWLEAHAMKAGRLRFMRRLEAAGVGERVRLVYPAVAADGGTLGIKVHAKVMVVDDRFLRVGSANLNNRSMGMDSECDLAIEAADDAQRRAIARVRNRLLGEHLGVGARDVARALEHGGSLLGAMEALAGGPHSLREIREADNGTDPLSHTVAGLADPERPIEASESVGDMFCGQPAGRFLARLGALILVGALLIALAVAWQLTPLSELAEPQRLRPVVDRLVESPWAPPLVLAVYIAAGLVVFPVTVLIALTAMVFEPPWALAYAAAGSLASAAVTYALGALAGRRLLRDVMGRRLTRISRALASKGILSIATVRLVPVAPFSLVNLAAGVSHVRFGDFLAGTVLGMVPGIVVMTALGHRFAEALSAPSAGDIALLALIVCLWLAMTVGLQILVSRARRSSEARPP